MVLRIESAWTRAVHQHAIRAAGEGAVDPGADADDDVQETRLAVAAVGVERADIVVSVIDAGEPHAERSGCAG